MIKHNALFKIAVVFLCVSAAVLIAAMIVHAVKGDGSDIAGMAAIASAGLSASGLLLVCISKEKKDHEVKCNEREEN